jgi:hypothetical protein
MMHFPLENLDITVFSYGNMAHENPFLYFVHMLFQDFVVLGKKIASSSFLLPHDMMSND